MKRLDLRRILCPIDLSPRTQATLATASAVARARGAELRAFHVIPAQGPTATRRIGSQQHQRLMSRLRAKLAEADLTYDRIGAAARLGDPATEILRFAREMPADLIVMGAPSADRPERPDGPVASVVVSRSECSVLTLPAAHPSSPSTNAGLFSRIVCGVDLVPSSASVIQQALSLAWEAEGRITYVCVVPNARHCRLLSCARSCSARFRRRRSTGVPRTS